MWATTTLTISNPVTPFGVSKHIKFLARAVDALLDGCPDGKPLDSPHAVPRKRITPILAQGVLTARHDGIRAEQRVLLRCPRRLIVSAKAPHIIAVRIMPPSEIPPL